MFSLDALFCDVDDFCLVFEPEWQKKLLSHGGIKRRRAKNLCLSEIMTILIAFHQNHYRNFKHFYLDYVKQHWHLAFPGLPSYQRFVEWTPSTLIPLCVYLKRCFGNCTGIGFVDATSLKVCQHGGCISWGNPSIPHRHNRRIKRHKVFDGLAQRGKTSVDWFCGATPLGFPQHGNAHQDGFKLHLVVNEIGQLLNAQLTPGNFDDRRPIPDLLQGLFGKFFADRGYVSQKLANQLLEEFGIQFFAKPRRNMKNKLMRLHDKLLSRHRSIIETINDQLKNISQIEHSRHRLRS